jgi:hypothetical protein
MKSIQIMSSDYLIGFLKDLIQISPMSIIDILYCNKLKV